MTYSTSASLAWMRQIHRELLEWPHGLGQLRLGVDFRVPGFRSFVRPRDLASCRAMQAFPISRLSVAASQGALLSGALH
jgi:hypothetical protein